MKIIRCLSCNKILGEVEGKYRIKCKMARCGFMNEGEATPMMDIRIDPRLHEKDWKVQSNK